MTPTYSTPSPPPQAVAVVGAASPCGAQLLRHLESALPDCRFVTFDPRPLRWPVRRVSAYRLHRNGPAETLPVSDLPTLLPARAWDIVAQSHRITLADINDCLRNEAVDSLIYLGSHYEGPDAAQFLRDTPCWLDAARTAGVRRFVYLSDYRVYGVRRGQPIPITERSDTGPLPAHRILRDGEPEPEPEPTDAAAMAVTVLRTAMTVGPNGSNPAAQEFFQLPLSPGRNPSLQLQFLHEYDLARAVTEVISRRLEGTYHLAGDGSISLAEVAALCLPHPGRSKGRRNPPPPETRSMRRKTANAARHPMIISATKFKQEAHFRFQYSARRAIRAYTHSVLLEPD